MQRFSNITSSILRQSNRCFSTNPAKTVVIVDGVR